MKLNEKNRAIGLRKMGKSYSEIKKQINVSRSSLSLWLRDVGLTQEQADRLKGLQKSRYESAKANREKRIKRTKTIIIEAKKELKKILLDSLFLPGLMLYWAEGSKVDTFERVNFSNSDPAMIKFMMRWFRKICKVPEKKFRINLHIHTLHCRKNIEEYWSRVTNIPLSQFYKTQIKPTSLGQRRNKLYNGTCNISISNRDLFRRIKGWRLGYLERIKIKIEN